MFGVKKRKPTKHFYQYDAHTAIGPTGDSVEAGVYWSKVYVGAFYGPADKYWVQYSNGDFELLKVRRRLAPEPMRYKGGKPVPKSVQTWLTLKAQHLGWFD